VSITAFLSNCFCPTAANGQAGASLAVCSDDGSVYLYTGSGSFVPKARCIGHSSGVSQCDFSADGKTLQTHSAAAHELLFFDVERGEQVLCRILSIVN
jgi:WD40 repeat protein